MPQPLTKPMNTGFATNGLTLCALAFLIITLAACSEPELDYIFIKNDTNITLDISAEFKKGATKLMPLTLAPGAEDGWRFSAKEEMLIGNFQQLRAKAGKCEVTFSKEQLKAMIQKDGAYRLVLNNNHIDC